MEPARVVEVVHDRGDTSVPRWLLGSGFVVRAGIVLTAAHNLGDSQDERGPYGTVVRCIDGSERPATVLARSDAPDGIDVALLAVPNVAAEPTRIGRLDRERIGVVRDVMAAGFPNFKHADERPVQSQRQPAQPVGFVPTIEDYSAGELTIKIDGGMPAPAEVDGASPWEGLSGGGVFVGDVLLGIIVRHHLAEGLGALRVVPLTRLCDLPPMERVHFCAILGIFDPAELPVADSERDPDDLPEGLIRELKGLLTLSEQGLLGPAELRILRVTAYKESKGWR